MPDVLTIELLSDTTFSSNASHSVEVDIEVDHDDRGCPVVSGKMLRGLLRDTWLSLAAPFADLAPSADRLFGTVADLEESGILRIAQGEIDTISKSLITSAVQRQNGPSPRDIFLAFTNIRHQTAEQRSTGSPAQHSLRSSRVLIRGLKLHAPIQWLDSPSPQDYACLAIVLLGTRHAGCGRNRGRGHLRLSLNDDPEQTRKLVQGLQ